MVEGIIGGKKYTDGRSARVFATGFVIGDRLFVSDIPAEPVNHMIEQLTASGRQEVRIGPLRAAWNADGA